MSMFLEVYVCMLIYISVCVNVYSVCEEIYTHAIRFYQTFAHTWYEEALNFELDYLNLKVIIP